MNTSELREHIIQKIRRTDDKKLLDYLNQLVSDKNDPNVYEHTDFEKQILEDSGTDYLAGRRIPTELQSILYSKIMSVTEEHQLSDLIIAIDQAHLTVYCTSEEQKAKIKEGQNQIAKGNYFTNEQVEKVIDEWLSKE